MGGTGHDGWYWTRWVVLDKMGGTGMMGGSGHDGWYWA